MKIKVKKIKYDVSSPEESKALPKTMTLDIDDLEYACAEEDPNEVEDLIGDIITDKTDICVLSFEYDKLNK